MNYVALDVGNVLVHINFKPFVEALSKSLNITVEDAEYFMNRTCKLHDMGLTCMEDELKDHFHIKSQPTMKELLAIWNKSISTNYTVHDKLIKWVTEKDLRVALLSNVGLEHTKVMEEILGLDNIPNLIRHFSCQVGSRKPNLLYYQSFLHLHPEFQGCAYVDDLQENLDTGAKFGFRTYHFALDQLPSHGINIRNAVSDLEFFIFEAKPKVKNSRWH
jgi:FMN phosphatase YigB (HAD superfamily)